MPPSIEERVNVAQLTEPDAAREPAAASGLDEAVARLAERAALSGSTLVTEDLARAYVADGLSGDDPPLRVLCRYEATSHPDRAATG